MSNQERINMTPAEWHLVRDNPIQRDTRKHAAKAEKGHLKKLVETHCDVSAARLPDGKLIKLDGHTRDLLWHENRLTAPDMLSVRIYPVQSELDAIRLYKYFDNQAAVENASDRLSGAYRHFSIEPKHRLLTHGGVSSAFIILNPNSRDIYAAVADWSGELITLDTLDASPKIMPSPLIAAALATFRKHRRKQKARGNDGRTPLQFWREYIAGMGVRQDGKSCGVDQLTRIVSELRAKKILGTGATAMRENQAGRAISCCEAWINNRTFTVSAKATDIRAYLEST